MIRDTPFFWAALFALLSNALAARVQAQAVSLNEFLAGNVSSNGLADEEGQRESWIELRNSGAAPVDLEGWSLTDDRAKPRKWVFPSVTIGPGQFLVVFASGKNRKPAQGTLHTNFKLGLQNQYLGLFNDANNDTAVSELAPVYPDQRYDYSYGRDALGNWVFFRQPTPGAPNRESGITAKVEKLEFSVPSGVFTNGFDLRLTTPTAGSVIRYTTDGSPPTESNGTDYTGPLKVTNTVAIRGSAFKSGAIPSTVQSRSYLFNPTPEIQSLLVVSMIIDPYDFTGRWGIQGIQGGVYDQLDCCFSVWRRTSPDDYFNPSQRGLAWERAVSMELLPSAAETGFRIIAGIRLRASDSSRLTYHPESKFSYTIGFNKDFGPTKLKYPLMPESTVTTFDGLVFRAGHNDTVATGGPFIRDELMRRLFADEGQTTLHGTFVNLFINGTYRGYYNLTEKMDENWAQNAYQSTNDWDVIKQYAGVEHGDLAAWSAMMNFSDKHNLAETANFRAMARLLDPTNFVDYVLLNIYADTRDWTQNNWYAARERTTGALFRFYVFDAEQSFGDVTHNMITETNELANVNPDPDTTAIPRLFRALSASPEFRLLFADRVQKHFSHGGALSQARVVERFQQMQQILSEVIPQMNSSIVTSWAPRREGVILGQFAEAGLVSSVAAPSFDQPPGEVAAGTRLALSATAGDIYYTLDGSDPRVMFTSAVSPTARRFTADAPIILNTGALIKTRARINDTWSALSQATFEIAPKLELARETGRAVLRFPAVVGTSYSVEVRSSFSGEAWQKLLDVLAPDNGTQEVIDPNPIEGNRFYRLVSPSTP